jgi:uncharacterized SAM-binding protein YcdF (DUF218 family)
MGILSAALRWFRRVIIVLGLLFLLVTFTPLVYWWATALAGPWEDPRGDLLIVLTGAGMEDVIGLNSYWRAVYAVRAYRAGEFPEILITGGGQQSPAAAVLMRDFITAQGVPAAAVRVESRSNNTRDSGQNVARLIGAEPGRYANRRLVLLTSDYHMYRSRRVFETAGLIVSPRPVPDIRKRYGQMAQRWGLFLELVLESVKILYYGARGWI